MAKNWFNDKLIFGKTRLGYFNGGRRVHIRRNNSGISLCGTVAPWVVAEHDGHSNITEKDVCPKCANGAKLVFEAYQGVYECR